MKKFSFSLESVLRYKGSLLDEEKSKLNLLRAELARIDDAMEENLRQLLSCDEKLKALAKKGCGISALRCISFEIDNARQLLDELKISRTRQVWLVEKQLAAVVEARQSVSGIERLKEKQLESYHEAQLKEEALTIGELVSTSYARANLPQ